MTDPALWATDVVLADGGVAQLRPAGPADAAALARFFAARSDESIYSRFFSYRRPSAADIERFLAVDYRDRFPFLVEHAGQIIAYAGYDLVPERASAEVAFLVDEAAQGRGIATILFEHLAGVARANGIRRLHAETLGANRPMLQVFTHAGYPVRRSLDGGIWDVEIDIADDDGAAAERARREQAADARSVARILAPRCIAVVGAGPGPDNLGQEILAKIVAGGYRGIVHPVHPTASEVLGFTAARHVDEIADQVDVAVIAVPAGAVEAVVADCGRAGVAAVVIVAAGFGDAGPDGAALESRVLAAARLHGMRVVGPNCMGVVNTSPAVRLDATAASVPVLAGRVAFASQSGAVGLAVLTAARDRGLGFSSFVSMGNKADVSSNDLLQYWDTDPDTDVVLLYLESFGNPRRFARIARRVSRTKPIVAVKSGRRHRGRRHPDSPQAGAVLATADELADALFRATGVIRVDTVDQLFDLARLLVHEPLPAGPRVAVVANSNGPAVLAADAAAAAGLDVRRMHDVGRSASPDQLAAALGEALADPGVDSVLAVAGEPRHGGLDGLVAAIAASAGGRQPKPVAAVVLGHAEPATGLPAAFAFPEPAAAALARASELATWRRRHAESNEIAVATSAADVIATALADAPDGRALTADESAALLHAAGVDPAWSTSLDDDGPSHITGLNDARFGPAVAVGGPAGRRVELAPLCEAQAGDLAAVSGAGRVGEAALADTLTRIGALVEAHPDLAAIVLCPSHAPPVRAQVRPAPAPELWSVRSLRRP
jgi:acyl-CoA synthetase (NDP forming)/RimJ/RimL family protein N-acetyltransferase